MLVIENIDKIVGMVCNGVHVMDAGQDVSKNRYTFKFDIPWVQSSFRSPIVEVVLERVPNSDGKYQLFAMGWQKVTYIDIHKSDIYHAWELAEKIAIVLRNLESYIKSVK